MQCGRPACTRPCRGEKPESEEEEWPGLEGNSYRHYISLGFKTTQQLSCQMEGGLGAGCKGDGIKEYKLAVTKRGCKSIAQGIQSISY